MANTKISNLTALASPAAGDLLAIVDVSASETKKITISDMIANSPNGGLAELGTANTWTAAQSFGSGASGGQIAIRAASASTVGLLVNSAASPTADIIKAQVNGTDKFRITSAGVSVHYAAYSQTIVTIGVNSVATVTPPGNNYIVVIAPYSSGGTPFGIVAVYGDGASIRDMVDDTGLIDTSTSVLTGTSGTSGRVTVSHNSGTLYIENRLAYGINYTLFFIGKGS